MKTVPLADVLWTAANRHLTKLADDNFRREWVRDQFPYTCDCVWYAMGAPYSGHRNLEQWEMAREFLRDLGCPGGLHAFDNTASERRQGARYMWLLLAMHVAADEGLTVEVPE